MLCAEPGLSDLKGLERSDKQGSLERCRYNESCGAVANTEGDGGGRLNRVFTYGQITL